MRYSRDVLVGGYFMRSFLAAVCLLFLIPGAAPARAEKRVALVVGNSAYQHTSKLANPKNDAIDVAAVLKKHGFVVVEGFDLVKTDLEKKVREFSGQLRAAEVGLFFYAGHGLQVGGHNYLVPVDAKAETADSLDWEMLRLDLVHRTMERATNTNIIFLDACRDNPLARNLARAMGTRSAEIGRGLAAVESGVGTLISFSTQPGNVALDGTGRNSPFAGALVRQLSEVKEDLSAILIAVRNDVMRETQRKQVPWEHSALTGRFYFKELPPIPTPAPASAPLSEAVEAWDRTKDSASIAALDAFIARYKDTYYADLARLRVQELKASQDAEAKRLAEKQREVKPERADVAAASLPADAPALKAPERPALAPQALAQAVQTELRRVGCNPGATDGVWRTEAKEALAKFARLSKNSLSVDAPNPAALDALLRQQGRVCPLVCSAGQKEVGGRCIAVRAARPPEKEAKVPKAEPAKAKLCVSTPTGSAIGPCRGMAGERPLN